MGDHVLRHCTRRSETFITLFHNDVRSGPASVRGASAKRLASLVAATCLVHGATAGQSARDSILGPREGVVVPTNASARIGPPLLFSSSLNPNFAGDRLRMSEPALAPEAMDDTTQGDCAIRLLAYVVCILTNGAENCVRPDDCIDSQSALAAYADALERSRASK